MTTDQLLAELEPLTHDGRRQYMIALGRLAVTETGDSDFLTAQSKDEATRHLAALAGGDFYSRLMAFYSCGGSRDGAFLLRFLRDPSHLISGFALGQISSICNDDQTVSALSQVGPKQALVLLRALFRRKRLGPIDRHITDIAEAGDAVWGERLAFGSKELVRRLLPDAVGSLWPE